MTVQELIDKLEIINDKTQAVKIAVYQKNKSYPVVYVDPWGDWLQTYNGVIIRTSLPEKMYTVQR